MHQYSTTSARKSGRSTSAVPLSGARFSIRPTSIDARMNHGLAGRRISSGDAGPNDPTLGSTLTNRLRSSSPALAAAFLGGFGFGRLLGPGRHRGGLRQHEQELAVIDPGERLA